MTHQTCICIILACLEMGIAQASSFACAGVVFEKKIKEGARGFCLIGVYSRHSGAEASTLLLRASCVGLIPSC